MFVVQFLVVYSNTFMIGVEMKGSLYRIVPIVGFIVGNVFSMNFRQNSFPICSLHALVTAQVSDDHENNKNYHVVNARDARGATPMHFLVLRNDSTIAQIDALIERGADPTIRTYISKSKRGGFIVGQDPYGVTIRYKGWSPVETPIDHFFENQCYGNKEVTNYIFCVILVHKLKKILPFEEAKRARKAKEIEERKKLEEEVRQLEQQQEKWKNATVWLENRIKEVESKNN